MKKRRFLPLVATAALGSAVMPAALAQVLDKLPDLVVTEVKMVPEHPVAGDAVRFQAVVKNQGTAPTPEGVVLGGVFKLNGSVLAYEDQYKHTLAPGETVILTGNGGGGAGSGTWIAKAGKYTLGFLVDDVNRIRESDKKNNEMTASKPIEVSAFHGPDLAVQRFNWTHSPGNRHAVRFQAAVSNEGNEPTPANVPVAVQFWVDGKLAAIARVPHALDLKRVVTVTAPSVAIAPGKHTVETKVLALGHLAERRTDNNSLISVFWLNEPLTLQAKPSDAFADSVGVCIHLGYYDTAYGHYDIIKQRLIQSGIRYVREGTNLSNTDILGKLKDLAASGIRCNLVLDPRQVSPEQAVTLVKMLGAAVVTVEGPNEPNLFDSDLFPDGIRDYQKRLYAALKSDPQTANVPILSPALAFPAEIAARLGPVACDFGAMHPYPGGQLPDAGLDGVLKATQIVAPDKPVMITETGYDTAIHVTSGQPAVSEAAEAKYLPRLLLEAFNRGVSRSFIYEFSDEHPEPEMHDAEQHFGLLHTDGTPKPALTVISTMLHRLQDRGSFFQTHTLTVRLTGDVTNLRHTLLQKRDGRRYLVLWVNGRSYNQNTQSDAAVSRQQITLDFAQPLQSIQVYRAARPETSIRTHGPLNTFTLDIADDPIVLEWAAEK
jgi:hypothetical protein